MGKNERQVYLKAIRPCYRRARKKVKVTKVYLKAIRPCYRRARKKVKVTILDEFCSVCGYNHKYAIRLLIC